MTLAHSLTVPRTQCSFRCNNSLIWAHHSWTVWMQNSIARLWCAQAMTIQVVLQQRQQPRQVLSPQPRRSRLLLPQLQYVSSCWFCFWTSPLVLTATFQTSTTSSSATSSFTPSPTHYPTPQIITPKPTPNPNCQTYTGVCGESPSNSSWSSCIFWQSINTWTLQVQIPCARTITAAANGDTVSSPHLAKPLLCIWCWRSK